MKNNVRIPHWIWRLMRRLNHLMLARYSSKSKAAERVLVLTTTGRVSGKPRLTPLQYEEENGVYYVASARGIQADWYKNLLKCPQVDVRVRDQNFSTLAAPMTDPSRIADFLELRLKRHPRFMGIMLRMEGLPRKHSRADLEKLAGRLAIVELPQRFPPEA